MQANDSYGKSIKYVTKIRKQQIKMLHFAFRPIKNKQLKTYTNTYMQITSFPNKSVTDNCLV